MGVDFYDCYLCKDTGIYSEYVVICDDCENAICSRCCDCRAFDEDKKITDFVDWENEKLDEENYCFKEGFCPVCIENKKILCKNNDITDKISKLVSRNKNKDKIIELVQELSRIHIK